MHLTSFLLKLWLVNLFLQSNSRKRIRDCGVYAEGIALNEIDSGGRNKGRNQRPEVSFDTT